jgi:hypothetical protein
MKKKITFGLQVFTTLILFMAIFVTYLERKDVQSVENINRSESISNATVSSESLIDLISSTFTTSFSGAISCGK